MYRYHQRYCGRTAIGAYNDKEQFNTPNKGYLANFVDDFGSKLEHEWLDVRATRYSWP